MDLRPAVVATTIDLPEADGEPGADKSTSIVSLEPTIVVLMFFIVWPPYLGAGGVVNYSAASETRT